MDTPRWVTERCVEADRLLRESIAGRAERLLGRRLTDAELSRLGEIGSPARLEALENDLYRAATAEEALNTLRGSVIPPG